MCACAPVCACLCGWVHARPPMHHAGCKLYFLPWATIHPALVACSSASASPYLTSTCLQAHHEVGAESGRSECMTFCALFSPVGAPPLSNQFLGDDNDLPEVTMVASGHSLAHGLGGSDVLMKLSVQAAWMGALPLSRLCGRPSCGTLEGEARE